MLKAFKQTEECQREVCYYSAVSWCVIFTVSVFDASDIIVSWCYLI